MKFSWWQHTDSFSNGYEVSTKGDRRFSALVAKVNGKTIEYRYQVEIKGYPSIKEGKGKPPLNCTPTEAWLAYKELWNQYLTPELEADLRDKAAGCMLTDIFANGPVSQARALAELLNEREEARIKESKMKTYTLVGSRKIIIGGNLNDPDPKLTEEERFDEKAYQQLKNVAYGLGLRGYILNACGAPGADQAGLDGQLDAKGKIKFFLPKDNHNGHKAQGVHPTNGYLNEIIEVWNKYSEHNTRCKWTGMGWFVQMLMIRSAMAVDASDFVVTYAKNEKLGGTAWTLFYAYHKDKKVFNLFHGLEPLKAYVKEAK